MAKEVKKLLQDVDADERHAWDLYFAHVRAVVDPDRDGPTMMWTEEGAANRADAMLEERRKRWGR